MKRYISLLLALIFVCVLFTGCGAGGNGKAPDVNGKGLKENDIKQTAEPEYTGPVNPLTGEHITADISSVRPFCVMINNHSEARPSKGLSNAAIVYEALVEGSITRMMAVFTDISQTDVGYVRSARPYYISLVQSYDAIYVHCGGSTQARSDIKNYGIADIDATYGHADSAWVRDPERVGKVSYEHTLYAKGSKLFSYAKEHFRMDHNSTFDTSYGLSFADNAVDQCTGESKDFTVFYYGSQNGSNTSTQFKYNSEKNCYNAYIRGTEYTDGADKHIDFANVIILNVDTATVDGKGHQEMNLVGTGNGFFCTGGKYVEIKWSRANRDDCFHYSLKDGTPLNLSVGKTFVSIAPLDSTDGVIW